MSSDNTYADEIYFFQDILHENCTTFGVGDVWIYFYKESMIGIRYNGETKETYRLKLPYTPYNKEPPTKKEITPRILDRGFSVVTGEVIIELDAAELGRKGKELLARELTK